MDGKVEIWECVYDEYTLRYSRWEPDFDRYAYFNETNEDATRDDWYIGDEEVGRTWVGLDDRPTATRNYRWLASYRDAPYEVLVQAVDDEARDEGLAAVSAKPP